MKIDDITQLRQIPEEIVEGCLQAKNQEELINQTRKIAQYLAQLPHLSCVHFPSQPIPSMMIKAWMANNTYMRTLASQNGIMQMLQDKDGKICNVLSASDKNEEPMDKFKKMVLQFHYQIKPLLTIWKETRVQGDVLQVYCSEFDLHVIGKKRETDPNFSAIFDIFAEQMCGQYAQGFKELCHPIIEPDPDGQFL